jgi:hypothetical protein
MILTGGNRSTWRQTCPGAIHSTIKLTWAYLRSNSGLHGGLNWKEVESTLLSNFHDFRMSIAFWKVPQLRLFPSGKGNIWSKANVEHLWKDTERGKPEYLERNLSQCHCIHHKSHIGLHGIEIGPPRMINLSMQLIFWRFISRCAVNSLLLGYNKFQMAYLVVYHNIPLRFLHFQISHGTRVNVISFMCVGSEHAYVRTFARNLQICGSMHETHNPQIWKENWDNAICISADQVSVSSQDRSILGSAYSEVHAEAPSSHSFQSSAFRAWNLDILGTG